MSKLRLFLVSYFHFFLLLLTQFTICSGIPVAEISSLKDGDIDAKMGKVCSKTIGECMTDAEMDSESNRRVLLMQKRYISYDTLDRDMVPCQRPGASYYSCNGRPANHYTRGCAVITRCARITDVWN